MIFLIPFVLIGLGLVAGFFHTLLGSFNPRPVLLVSSGTAPLGATLTLSHRFEGGTGRIRHLQVLLIGREEATYRRGTSTYTDKEEFFSHPLVDTNDPQAIASGRSEFAIPFESMHTFESDNNKVLWRIQVKGDIARWPDIDESFAFTVLPLTPGDAV